MEDKWLVIKILYKDEQDFNEIQNVLALMNNECFEKNDDAVILYTKDKDLSGRIEKRLSDRIEDLKIDIKETTAFWNKVLHGDFKSIEVQDFTIKSKDLIDGKEDKEKTIIINPAQAFGSGQHATTRQCIELISWLNSRDSLNDLLEPGCGSSILSIFSKKLGIAEAYAFDNDLTALYNAIENQKLNEVNVNTFCMDLSYINKRFDLVTANIFAHVLINNHDILIDYVDENKYLILSGIEDDQAEEVKDSFSDLKLIRRVSFEGWTSFLFRKKN